MTRSEFLKTTIECCKNNLAKPNIMYNNGRMSHDVEREELARATEQLYDMQIDGNFDAYGKFVSYNEED
jgi:hypothetical protein